MQAKIFFITLGGANLSRSVAFYHDALGQEFYDEVTGADGCLLQCTSRPWSRPDAPMWKGRQNQGFLRSRLTMVRGEPEISILESCLAG